MSNDNLADIDVVCRIIHSHVSVPSQSQPMPHSGLREIGLDSLSLLIVIFEIEEALGRKVFLLENVDKMETVGDLLMLVERSRSTVYVDRPDGL